MYVAERWRGQGIGRSVMKELLSRARAVDGIEQVILTVAATQAAARRLYESLGFQSFGCEPCALRVGDACVDEEYMMLRQPSISVKR